MNAVLPRRSGWSMRMVQLGTARRICAPRCRKSTLVGGIQGL